MCIEDNRARIVLTEDLGQTNARNDAGTQDVFEHRAGTDGRKLIHVADKDEMRPRKNGAKQVLHEHNIHHRNLVHDDDICLKLRLRVAPEAHLPLLPALCFEHAVHRRSRASRCLCEALCRASRRRGKQDLKSLRTEDVDDAAYDGGLARPGTACQDEDTVLQRGDDRLPLRRGEADMMLLLP